MNLLAVAVTLAGLGAGCDWDPLHTAGAPSISAGEDGLLPAVVDLRRSGVCPAGVASFSVRFSKPMNRANVENALSFSEILGDIRGSTQPKRDAAALPDPKTFTWEDSDRQVSFRANLIADRMYTLKLSSTVTDRTGKGLDGEVGPDVDGDGVTDIVMDTGQYARSDDDYLRKPIDFTSLPFYLCGSSLAAGIWRVPLNDSRPRVLELAGLLPDNDSPARYVASSGYFPFGTTDGVLSVLQPLPPRGILRLQIGSPNTAPTRGFSQQNVLAPVLPSTLVGNIEITDADERDYKAAVYLDDRIRLKAPLVGLVKQAVGNMLTADALAGLGTDVLKGMQLVAQGNNGYVFALPITGNSADALWVDPVFLDELQTVRPDPEVLSLFFPHARFRENETRGLKLVHLANLEGVTFGGELIAEGNTSNVVRFGGGSDFSGLCSTTDTCIYRIYVNLAALGFLGKNFEIVPHALYLHTQVLRPKGQIFEVRLNSGETPISDIYGRTFVDGRADGNDRGVADDHWIGSFSSGDLEAQPIPPTLQLNDGRWYSIFPNGSSVGSTLALPPHGNYTYLGDGVMGHYEPVCRGSEVTPELTELGMVFATPDGSAGGIGADDLLWMITVNASNFGGYRLSGLQPEAIPTTVTGSTVHADIYRNGGLLRRIPITLVRIASSPEVATVTVTGNDGICGTADDLVKSKTRPWIAGDRIILSHRIRHPKGDANSLDGNYDGVLDDSSRDDMILEYQPGTALPFRRIP